ncbi:hypothetical protein [Lignipirellula cremea]|uniref:Uncharacterized protein n=1 Tax=Lignipirellula cremea TaxID=2528010 RepID=A0A518DX86_9BACT|nr:hypothetical protein [Lignipirellula cremea]QDU96432.1 hypothetical protein Pla8534_42530 [Lignipirellula cremea]
MSGGAIFIQRCPTCNRRLEVRVNYLGKMIACRHCRARFEARDPSTLPVDLEDLGLLARVDQLLLSTDYQPHTGRLPVIDDFADGWQ